MTGPSDARSLEGRVVAITGALSGIGRATALAFASRNASVVLIARGADGLCGGRSAMSVPTATSFFQIDEELRNSTGIILKSR